MPSGRRLQRARRPRFGRPSRRGRRSAVILELERDRIALRFLAQTRNDPLELVPALAADPDGVALDLALHLGKVIAQHLADLLGQVFGQTPPQADLLADGVAAGGLDRAPLEDLEREPTPNRFGLNQVANRLGTEL